MIDIDKLFQDVSDIADEIDESKSGCVLLFHRTGEREPLRVSYGGVPIDIITAMCCVLTGLAYTVDMPTETMRGIFNGLYTEVSRTGEYISAEDEYEDID